MEYVYEALQGSNDGSSKLGSLQHAAGDSILLESTERTGQVNEDAFIQNSGRTA